MSYDDGHSEYDIHSELLSVTYENGTELGSEPITVVTSDFVVLNSKLNGEPLYNMVRMNDALPLLDTLYNAVESKAAEGTCIEPTIDGRIIAED